MYLFPFYSNSEVSRQGHFGSSVLEYALLYVKVHTYYSVHVLSVHVLSVHVCEEMHRLKSHHRQLDQKATLRWCCLMVNCPPHRDNSYPV